MVKIKSLGELVDMVRDGSGRDYKFIEVDSKGRFVFDCWLDDLPLEYYNRELLSFSIRNGLIPDDPDLPPEENTTPTYIEVRLK